MRRIDNGYRKDFNMIYMWNHLSHVITQNQEMVAMTSTAISKRVFKSQTALK